MEQFLAEQFGVKAVALPVDMNTAAITGNRIAMNKADRIAIVMSFGDSTAAVVDFTLKQHNAATAGTSKVLEIDNPYFHKVGAATSFTKVEPTVKASNFELSTLLANDEGIVIMEILQEDLDVNNGFNHISVDFIDSTAAKILGAVYLAKAQYKSAYSIAL